MVNMWVSLKTICILFFLRFLLKTYAYLGKNINIVYCGFVVYTDEIYGNVTKGGAGKGTILSQSSNVLWKVV